MELLIYNHNLYRAGVIDNFNSLIWTRKYYGPGDFELHIPLTSDEMQILIPGNYIYKGGVEAGIIESITRTINSTIQKTIIKGRFLSSLLDRRIIKNAFTFSGKSEVAMRNLIGRVSTIPNLELGELNNFDETITFQTSFKGLLETEEKIAKTSGLGFRISPDFLNKKLLFETYKGIDRTQEQSFANRVIFSEEYGNLKEIQYSYNDQLLKSTAYVGGEGEGNERVFVTVGSGAGLNLREVFVDAKDISSEDFTSNEDYLEALKQRGLEKLTSYAVSESYEYDTLPDGTFIYKTNYDLGDIVTIEKKDWNMSETKRITEIQEIYENGGMKIVLTLGNPIAESVDWSVY